MHDWKFGDVIRTPNDHGVAMVIARAKHPLWPDEEWYQVAGLGQRYDGYQLGQINMAFAKWWKKVDG